MKLFFQKLFGQRYNTEYLWLVYDKEDPTFNERLKLSLKEIDVDIVHATKVLRRHGIICGPQKEVEKWNEVIMRPEYLKIPFMVTKKEKQKYERLTP